MIQNTIAHPKVVGKDEWLTARKTLLEHEKELTKQRDSASATMSFASTQSDADYQWSNLKRNIPLKDQMVPLN